MTIIVIGAGIGGLATAIALAAAGEEVVVLERQAAAGGKARPEIIDGAAFDTGPTVFTMRWVFDELFARAGDSFQQHVSLQPLDILARHYWSGGAALDLHADRSAAMDAISTFAGTPEADAFARFSREAAHIYELLEKSFLRKSRPTPVSLAFDLGFNMFSINPFESLWGAVSRHFRDARLRQLFARYATYCGTSPFSAPATLMLVAHVEQMGVWRISGGMAGLVAALEAKARALGVAFHFDAEVSRIEVSHGRVSAVIDAHGARHSCDVVVVNGDAQAVAHALFGDDVKRAVDPASDEQLSLSAITWCAKVKVEGAALHHHTVFFSDDYQAEFEALREGPAHDPTVYMCDQGEGRKLILINALALSSSGASRHLLPDGRSENAMLARLAKCGVTLQWPPEQCLRRTPQDFAALYPATQGALYGRASNGWQSTFIRPQAMTAVPGLFLAGGSVHPGPGVPMAALSGMRAADAVLNFRASMKRFHRMDTGGGMSMR